MAKTRGKPRGCSSMARVRQRVQTQIFGDVIKAHIKPIYKKEPVLFLNSGFHNRVSYRVGSKRGPS